MGATTAGVAEDFPTDGVRSFYGAAKLRSEMLVQEDVSAYGLRATITPYGVITGAGQLGTVERACSPCGPPVRPRRGEPLRYIGYGGSGRQVRDLLHPEDLHHLLARSDAFDRVLGDALNAGGSVADSVRCPS